MLVVKKCLVVLINLILFLINILFIIKSFLGFIHINMFFEWILDLFRYGLNVLTVDKVVKQKSYKTFKNTVVCNKKYNILNKITLMIMHTEKSCVV